MCSHARAQARHCEELLRRSNRDCCRRKILDCFAALAMTAWKQSSLKMKRGGVLPRLFRSQYFKSPLRLCLARHRLAERGLRGGEAGDRDAVGRAGDVVEADRMAEGDGGGIAAVLAADADLERGARLTTACDADLDELADAFLVERDEGIDRQDALGHVGAEEARGIVTADAVRRLREVIGAEREELGALRDLGREQAGARQLDHCADLI